MIRQEKWVVATRESHVQRSRTLDHQTYNSKRRRFYFANA